MAPARNSNLLTNIEGARFISSLMIVLFHYSAYVNFTSAHYQVTRKFYIAVDLFFVISGIVIAHRYDDRLSDLRHYGEFLRRRIARIYPLHLLTLVGYAALGLAGYAGYIKLANLDKYDFNNFIPGLLLVHAWGFARGDSFNYVSWSLSAEFFVYLTFPIIAGAVRSSRAGGAVFVAATLVAGCMLSTVLFDRDVTELTWQGAILAAVPGFGLGVWLHRHGPAIASRMGPAWSGATFYLASTATLAAMSAQAPDRLILIGAYAVAATAFFCDLTGRSTLVSHRSVSSRGYLTYSLYMLHPVVATLFLSFAAPRLLGTSPAANVAAIAAAIAVTYGLSVLSYRWIEQPARRLIATGSLRARPGAERLSAAPVSA